MPGVPAVLLDHVAHAGPFHGVVPQRVELLGCVASRRANAGCLVALAHAGYPALPTHPRFVARPPHMTHMTERRASPHA